MREPFDVDDGLRGRRRRHRSRLLRRGRSGGSGVVGNRLLQAVELAFPVLLGLHYLCEALLELLVLGLKTRYNVRPLQEGYQMSVLEEAYRTTNAAKLVLLLGETLFV